jgi:hypothetical protein
MIKIVSLSIVLSASSVYQTGFAATAEALLGYHIDSRGVTFQVSSNGCTSKKSLQALLMESSPIQLQLNRTTPDRCRAYVPYGVNVFYSFEELGISPGSEFRITNPMKVLKFH